MMRRLLTPVALLVCWTLTPGAGELTENVVHLLVNGHAAHAYEDAQHQPDDPEHGCSGPFHLCSCHHSTPFVPPATVASSLGDGDGDGAWQRGDDADASDYRRGVFRPPQGSL